MSDLISRQAAIDALEREQSLVERPITETRWFDLGLRKAQDVLSELPSADAVPIVRCKDCRFWERGHSYCPDNMKRTEADWFCAGGERKVENV